MSTSVQGTCPPNDLCPVGNFTLEVASQLGLNDLQASVNCAPGGFAWAQSFIYGVFKVEYSTNSTVISDGSADFVGTMSDSLSGSGYLNSSSLGLISCGSPTGMGAAGAASIWNDALSPTTPYAWVSNEGGYAYSGYTLDLIVTWTILVYAHVDLGGSGSTTAYAGASFPVGANWPTSHSNADFYGVWDCPGSNTCASYTVTVPAGGA
jgi:hypothetical protein